jgi:hypothetical protein
MCDTDFYIAALIYFLSDYGRSFSNIKIFGTVLSALILSKFPEHLLSSESFDLSVSYDAARQVTPRCQNLTSECFQIPPQSQF